MRAELDRKASPTELEKAAKANGMVPAGNRVSSRLRPALSRLEPPRSELGGECLWIPSSRVRGGSWGFNPCPQYLRRASCSCRSLKDRPWLLRGQRVRTSSTEVAAARGTITDTTGVVLANSIQTYDIAVNQVNIRAYVHRDDDGNEVGRGPARAARRSPRSSA